MFLLVFCIVNMQDNIETHKEQTECFVWQRSLAEIVSFWQVRVCSKVGTVNTVPKWNFPHIPEGLNLSPRQTKLYTRFHTDQEFKFANCKINSITHGIYSISDFDVTVIGGIMFW